MNAFTKAFKAAMAVSIKAHQAGFATEAKAGKLRLVTVTYDAQGKSTVTPHTDWLTAEEADKMISH